MRASASPIYDAAGKINGVVASARDVTDAKAAEKQNLQKEKLAAMGEMMSGVAHELNNPLTAILGRQRFVARTRARRCHAPADGNHIEAGAPRRRDRAESAGLRAAFGAGAQENAARGSAAGGD